jgi:hypothetical protein
VRQTVKTAEFNKSKAPLDYFKWPTAILGVDEIVHFLGRSTVDDKIRVETYARYES